MIEADDLFLEKATESLDGALSEFASARYNNSANRSYYSCFQAAIHALIRANLRPLGDGWGHAFVQSQFVGLLVNRRKLYSTDLRPVLEQNYRLREVADYFRRERVGEERAGRAARRAEAFVAAIREGGSRSP